jgi:polysaccharide chain length determinant protein (PEP-CTERM system associated)
MASFRIRTPAEYLLLLWRRRYFILIPFLIVSGALCYAVYRLPNVYESSAFIIVDPPKVSTNYVQPVNTLDATARLSALQKLVTSRTELQRLIERFNLYPEQRQQNAPVEALVERMAKQIEIKPQSAAQGVYAFTISYRYAVPDQARDVTAELTSRLINANSDSELQKVYTTVDQIEERVRDVRQQLEKIETERARYYITNPDASPNQEQSLVGQLNSLGTVRQSQQTSIDALRSQISLNEQLLGTLKSQADIEPETPLAVGQTEGQLRTRRAELEGRLRKLLTEYTEKAPEVKAVRAEIESLNAEFDDLKKSDDQSKQVKRAARANNPQVAQLELKLAADRRDLKQKEDELARINARFAELQARLNRTPLLAVEALKIDRDYTTLRKRYEDLLAQQDNARFSAKVINDFSGETFRLIDPASLPEQPVSPQRRVLYPLSLLLGLAAGLLAAGASLARELVTIRDARDVAHYAGLPLLVSVPELTTENERRLAPLVTTAKIVGAGLLILVSWPLLYQLIKLSRVLDLFTQSSY